MHFLTKLSLRRPVSTLLALLALFVFGAASVFTFEMELYPKVSAPIIGVFVNYEGADAETVEKLVTQPIEDFGSKLQ